LPNIHATALVSPDALIGRGSSIGPYCVIGGAVIGEGTVIHSHVVISDGVSVGSNSEIFPGAVIGKEPKGAGATARIAGFERFVRIGDGCSISPHSIIYYDVVIGSGTLIGDGASIREQCRIGSNCVIGRYVTINYASVIGDRVKIMDGSHITGNTTIGAGSFLSVLVSSVNDRDTRAGYGAHVIGPSISEDVVVGAGAILLPGVQVGARSSVAAGSLVSRDVPPDTVVAGSPARPCPPGKPG
jgi:UDP-3-O-[3-hydroxymyristoyl] glucosamine N-acyltransferase